MICSNNLQQNIDVREIGRVIPTNFDSFLNNGVTNAVW